MDGWFYAALGASVVAVGLVLLPFANALLFAVTTVVVTWPLYTWTLVRTRGRRGLAAAITVALLSVLVFTPLTVVGVWFVQQAGNVVQQAVEVAGSGAVEAQVSEVLWEAELPGEEVWGAWLPEGVDPVQLVVSPLRDAVVTLGQTAGAALPQLVGSVVGATLDVFVFLAAVVSLYMEGPRVARGMMRLTPMRDVYEVRLFKVFREFSNNLVAGSLATAMLQGTIASIGYALAGVERLAFVATLTTVFALLPLVGSAVVWVPVSVYIGFTQGWGWGLFLAAWNIALTGSVDNIVRPLFLRGSTHIHPLLIFLALLGGVSWMGLPGALVGPVAIAAFLALYTIYCEDFAGTSQGPAGP